LYPSGIPKFWIRTGPDGALWFVDESNSSIGRITTVTPAISGKTPTSGAAGRR
jgi:streptogramin lyase